ncbi:MAG: DoxX family protein [Candidatus Velthaea sp.]
MMNDVALLLARAYVGTGIAAHGAQKAFGVFGGPGPHGAAQFMDSLGLKPGARYGAAASYNEIASGTMIALGIGGPLGPAMLASNMIVAATTVHAKNGFFNDKGGVEFPGLYMAAALAFAGAGYGRFSLDETLGLEDLRSHWATGLALAGAVLGALGVLSQRRIEPHGSIPGVNGEAAVQPEPAGSPG